MQTPKKSNVLGYLIAGGQATRMGGVNKATVPFHGTPMGQLVIRALAAQTAEVWVSANRDEEIFESYGARRVLADRLEGFLGPLAGLEALDDQMPPEYEWILIAPCDVPALPTTMVEFFAKHYAEDPSTVLTVRADGRTHNTIALVNRVILPTVRPTLLEGDSKVGLWMKEMGAKVCDWPDEGACFSNVNTLEELKLLEK